MCVIFVLFCVALMVYVYINGVYILAIGIGVSVCDDGRVFVGYWCACVCMIFSLFCVVLMVYVYINGVYILAIGIGVSVCGDGGVFVWY